MRAAAFDPRRLDIPRFARDAARLGGDIALADLPRLHDSLHPQAPLPAVEPVTWQAEGEARPRPGGEPALWLHLRARAGLPLVCQRCLGPVDTELRVERSFRFERDETRAAALDAEVEEDVLVLGRRFDLLELIEDELLLALPLVPRHERCPAALPVASPETAPDEQPPQPHPFAALAVLKNGRRDEGPDGQTH